MDISFFFFFFDTYEASFAAENQSDTGSHGSS